MKYKNETQTVDGISFHSKKEAAYYSQLKIEKRCGLIKSFERQVSFDLFGASPKAMKFEGVRVCAHIVDFVVTLKDGSKEIREVKGFATDVWDLKRKLFEANYPELPYKVIR
jgi:hypothetical protein